MAEVGNFPSSRLIDTEMNSVMRIAPFGGVLTTSLSRLVGTHFSESPLSNSLYISIGNTAIVGGELILSTAGGPNIRSAVQTRNLARAISSNINNYIAGITLAQPAEVNCIKRWGMFDPLSFVAGVSGNGMFYEWNGVDIRLVTRKNGVDTAIAEADFKGNNTFVKSTNLITHEIFYSSARALFLQARRFVHSIVHTTTPLYATANLPIGFEIMNINGNANVNTMASIGCACSRMGEVQARQSYVNITVSGTVRLKGSAGRLHSVILNKKSVGVASLTLYDSPTASGATIATIDLTASGGIGTILFNLDYDFGLTYVLATSGGAVADVTILFD